MCALFHVLLQDHIRNDNFGRKLIQSTVEEESENEMYAKILHGYVGEI